MRAVVRKQAIILGVGMGAGILSIILASLASWAFHVSQEWVSTAAWGGAMLLLLKVRPDFFR
jgi:hypothetical protein